MYRARLWIYAFFTWAVMYGASYLPLDQIFSSPLLFFPIASLWVLGIGGLVVGFIYPPEAGTKIKWVILLPPACLLLVMYMYPFWLSFSYLILRWDRERTRMLHLSMALEDLIIVLSVFVAYYAAVRIADIAQRRLRPLVYTIFGWKP